MGGIRHVCPLCTSDVLWEKLLVIRPTPLFYHGQQARLRNNFLQKVLAAKNGTFMHGRCSVSASRCVCIASSKHRPSINVAVSRPEMLVGEMNVPSAYKHLGQAPSLSPCLVQQARLIGGLSSPQIYHGSVRSRTTSGRCL